MTLTGGKGIILVIFLLALSLILAHFIFLDYQFKGTYFQTSSAEPWYDLAATTPLSGNTGLQHDQEAQPKLKGEVTKPDQVFWPTPTQSQVKNSIKKGNSASLIMNNSKKPKTKTTFSCGKWQARYAAFHRYALKTPNTARFLVYTCLDIKCGGLGNRMFGIASLLYLAVLTDRVFLIHWEGATQLRDYLKPREIKWDYPINLLKNDDEALTKYHYWGCSKPRKRTKYTDIKLENASELHQRVLNTNFSATLPLQYELIGTIRYFGDQVINNRYLKLKASTLGLPRKDSKFPLATLGCAYDFLFQPTNKLSALILKYRKSLMPKHKVSKPRKAICMHIRTSDYHFGIHNPDSIRTTKFKNFFTCAEKVEEYIYKSNLFDIAPNEEIKWFLATDNSVVKKYAKTTYGDKLLTVDVKPEHLDWSRNRDSLGMILLDMTLLTECHLFLATAGSSFSSIVIAKKRHSLNTFVYGEQCDGTRLAKILRRGI